MMANMEISEDDPFIEANDDIRITVMNTTRPPDINEFVITRSEIAYQGEFMKSLGNTGITINGNVGFMITPYFDIKCKTENSFENLFNIKINQLGQGRCKRQIVLLPAENLRLTDFDKNTFQERESEKGEQSLSLRRNTCNLCLNPFTVKSLHVVSNYHVLQRRLKRISDPNPDLTTNHVAMGFFLDHTKVSTVHWTITPENQTFPLDLYSDRTGNSQWEGIVYYNKTQGIELATDLPIETGANQIKVINLNGTQIRQGVNKSKVSLKVNTTLPLEADVFLLYEFSTPNGSKTIKLKLTVSQGITNAFHLEGLEVSNLDLPANYSVNNVNSWLGLNYLMAPRDHEMERYCRVVLNRMEQDLLQKNNLQTKVTPLTCHIKKQHLSDNWRLLTSTLTEHNYVEKFTFNVLLESNNTMNHNNSYKVKTVNSVAEIPNTTNSRLILDVKHSNLVRLNIRAGYQVMFDSVNQRFTGCLEQTGEFSCSFIVNKPPQEIDTTMEFNIMRLDNKFLCLAYLTGLQIIKEKNLVSYFFPKEYNPKDVVCDTVEFYQSLSSQQEEAVGKALNHNPTIPFLISGPAGTGKSYILLEVILQLLQRHPEQKIMLVNPTNHGLIDLHRKLTLLLEAHLDGRFKALKVVSPAQPKGPTCTHCFLNASETHHEYPPPEYIARFAVLLCTPTVALRLGYLDGLRFELSAIIVDEACFLTEPDTVTAIAPHVRGHDDPKPLVILAGDTVQLTYQPRSSCAKLGGYGQSTMKRLSMLELYKSNSDLFVEMWLSFRNPETMVSLMNSLAYQGQVTSAVTTHKGEVIACHSTSIAKKAPGDKSTYSDVEAATCLVFANECRHNNPDKTIVILCCYVAQVAIFNQLQGAMFPPGNERNRFKVVTTETIQGSEADIIFLCPTIQGTFPKGPKKYFWPSNVNRLTMSISRAKYKFYLVGDLLLLNRIAPFKRIIDKARDTGDLLCHQHIKDLLDYDNR